MLLVMDGLGGLPRETDGLTELEAAHTPNLDRLAAEGICGLHEPVAPGVTPGSGPSHLALFGYDPLTYRVGRGALSAMGIGFDLGPHDVAARGNYATVDADGRVTDRRAGRISTALNRELCARLRAIELPDAEVMVETVAEHRFLLVLRGEGLGQNVSDVDPHAVDTEIWIAKGADPASQKTATVLNKFVAKSYEILKDLEVNKQRVAEGKLPANVALPRGVGTAPALGDFNERNHVKAACIVETGLIRGIGVYLNMDIVDVEGATGGLDSDLQAMARAIVAALADHTFVLCNMKGPDIAGHDGDAQAKIKIIEAIDAAVKTIIEEGPQDLILAITGDHSTPVDKGDHGGDAVPFLLHGPGVTPDRVTAFGEGPCGAGSLGTFVGQNVTPMLTNLMNVQPKFGA